MVIPEGPEKPKMGTDREPLPYLVGNYPSVTIYGHGIPHWSGNTITRLGNTVFLF